MTTYRVVWEIEVEADTSVAAALEAEEILHDGDTHPLVYSEHYRIVDEVDCRKETIIATHGARKGPDW